MLHQGIVQSVIRKADWLLSSKNTCIVIFFSLLTYAIFYRSVLYYQLYHLPPNESPPVGFLPEVTSKITLCGGLGSDTEATVVIVATVWLALLACRRVIPARFGVAWRVLSTTIVGMTLTLVVVVDVAHQALLWQLGTGATLGIAQYAVRGSYITEYLSYMTATDWIMLTGMLPILAFYWLVPWRHQSPVRLAILAICAVFFLCKLQDKADERRANRLSERADALGETPSEGRGRNWFPLEIAQNPVIFFMNSFRNPTGTLDAEAPTLSRAQVLNPRVVESLLVTGPRRPTVLIRPRTDGGLFNLLLIQMEGVSRKYALSGAGADSSFMPFLENLSSQAVVLEQHYSSGVDTDHGVFSLFTGLFPVTQPIPFDERSGLRLPTLFSFLQGTHHSFFVTGSDLREWYPEALLKNTGLQEVIDARNSTASAHKYLDQTIRDEEETGTILREMVQKASQPFVGVYYPYATHWPYTVYGDAGNKVSKTSKLARYGYNLRLVDDQVRKLFEVLRTRGILDRTIVVITADHGEAFGDQGTWGHGTSLLDIAVHVPMVIYQPRVFVPRHVDTITSHVDILPTLLDAMGVRYDPAQFQGESLFRAQTRPYSFFYSPKTNQLGSIDFRGQKLVVDFARDSCWTVNVVADPNETSLRPCDRGSPQLAALKVFRRYNTELLFHLASENASGEAVVGKLDISHPR
jgi:hypothetical protein